MAAAHPGHCRCGLELPPAAGVPPPAATADPELLYWPPPPASDAVPAPERRRGGKRAGTVVTLAGYDIQGVSVGGVETCIILPQLKLAFDIGRCPTRAAFQPTLLLSHGHLDHAGGVHLYAATRALHHLPPPTIVAPPAIAGPLHALMTAAGQLDGTPLAYGVAELSPGQERRLTREHLVRPFPTDHVVPSQGYVVFSTRARLKPGLRGETGPEIARLRKAGVAVCDVTEVAEVAFTGDTTADWITSPGSEAALTARLLIAECTFVCDTQTPADARSHGHTHLDEIIAAAGALDRVGHILLIHFSARYSAAEIASWLDRKLPETLRGRVTALLVGF